jgi:hypothetical protein
MARKVEEMGDKTDEKGADKVGYKNPQKGLDTKNALLFTEKSIQSQ